MEEEAERVRKIRLRRDWALTPEERLRRFTEMQERAMALLKASPKGWDQFIRRSHRARSVSRQDQD